jgi:hypothetical protein
VSERDCSKDLILDSYGCDPTLVTSLTASSNILFDNVFAANITTKNASYFPCINPSCATFLPLGFILFGSFSKELRTLFDRFTTIIFEREQDSFCRSLSSIRKYYLNSWSTMCMSMSAALALRRLDYILLLPVSSSSLIHQYFPHFVVEFSLEICPHHTECHRCCCCCNLGFYRLY